MKQYKLEILERLEEKARGENIINFRKTANEAGFNHIKTQEVLEICNKFLKLHPDYKLVKMVSSEKDNSSLFCTAALIHNSMEFED